jgi:hypothetical protein
MISRHWLVFGALTVSACTELQPTSYCAIANDPDRYTGKVVSITATGTFTDHGAYIQDPRCSKAAVRWEETPAFRSSSKFDEFSASVTKASSPAVGPATFKVTVVGKFEKRSGHRIGVLQVRRVTEWKEVAVSDIDE